ncbi:hypothetical protein JOD31_003736 [Methylopila capsulata]|uniref:DUF2946 domain-containing protein n=1 Tax=Methylopila capsulata TaxID=61654 RepID=A0ABS2TB98_9HYPH|nr:hypothetical protein [Methylopila capsulata]MBM7853475.1 hypothetical protein [Methylopila capsulata]
MGRRLTLFRLIFAVVAAYVLVAQAALGGFAGGRHAALAGADPFAVLCSTLAKGGAETAGHDAADMAACCTLGCVGVAIAPASEPEVAGFDYPRARPAPRPAADPDAPASAVADAVVRRPRGPPVIG